jgi:hypothetical protein
MVELLKLQQAVRFETWGCREKIWRTILQAIPWLQSSWRIRGISYTYVASSTMY